MKKLLLTLVLVLVGTLVAPLEVSAVPIPIGVPQGVAQAVVDAAPIGPRAIPCVPSLPCIKPETQAEKEGTKNFVIDTFGTSIISTLLGFTSLACVFGIIIGGMQMHFAFGNEDAISKAKKTVMWSVVGLVIAILAVAIVSIISKLFA